MLFVTLFTLLWGTAARPGGQEEHQVYTRVNLVSDIAGVARFTDANLMNPWGLGFRPASPFWVADNGVICTTPQYAVHGILGGCANNPKSYRIL